MDESKPKKPKAKAKPKKKKPKPKVIDNLIELPKRRPEDGRPVEWTEERALQLGSELLAWMQDDDDHEHIFFQEFLLKKGVAKQRISDLSSKYPAFQELIKEAKQIQEFKLNQYALKQKVNPVMAIFLLKNHHNYADKQEVKTENVNYNYDPSDLRAKTSDELLELLNQETNTTR